MLGLLFLPLDELHVPGWLALLVPLAAFGALALGAWLMGRVPASRPLRSRNPLRPLTGAGMPPVVERPAGAVNRLAAVASLALSLAGAAAFLLVSGGFGRQNVVVGVLVMCLVGLALAAYGLMVANNRAPAPAWQWVRTPLRGGPRSGVPLMLAGFAVLTWGLVLATDAGYLWGRIGLALLIVGGVLVAPLARRSPRSEN
jgi:hypothetical protein